MARLGRREALKRIDWLVNHRPDALGRITLKEHDLINLRTVLELAEIGLRQVEQGCDKSTQMTESFDRMPGATISEAVMRDEMQSIGHFPSPQL